MGYGLQMEGTFASLLATIVAAKPSLDVGVLVAFGVDIMTKLEICPIKPYNCEKYNLGCIWTITRLYFCQASQSKENKADLLLSIGRNVSASMVFDPNTVLLRP